MMFHGLSKASEHFLKPNVWKSNTWTYISVTGNLFEVHFVFFSLAHVLCNNFKRWDLWAILQAASRGRAVDPITGIINENTRRFDGEIICAERSKSLIYSPLMNCWCVLWLRRTAEGRRRKKGRHEFFSPLDIYPAPITNGFLFIKYTIEPIERWKKTNLSENKNEYEEIKHFLLSVPFFWPSVAFHNHTSGWWSTAECLLKQGKVVVWCRGT